MKKKQSSINEKSLNIWANKLQKALEQERQHYIESVRGLNPLGKAEAFLQHAVKKLESYGDHEAAVYLASRGMDFREIADDIHESWRNAADGVIRDCAEGSSIFNVDTGRTKRRIGAMSIRQAKKVEARTVHELRNFWGFYDTQELSIDSTMLRTVEWCGITGFAPWWNRLANEEQEAVLRGGVSGVQAVYRLFNLCRSDLAIKLMGQTLIRVLEACEIPESRRDAPWSFFCQRNHKGKDRYLLLKHYACAAMLAFSRLRLMAGTERPENVSTAVRTLLKFQMQSGGWPTWQNEHEADVETTAIAIHALTTAKPKGWKGSVQRAVEWLWSVQDPTGCWSEKGSPDAVYLTVLVLDAIELAKGSSRITFKFSSTHISGSKVSFKNLFQYDAFISHASEDKDEFVRPLAKALSKLGLRIWFDEFELRVGDSLRRSIDRGLSKSAYGIVVLSRAFFAKQWPQYELDGLVSTEMSGRKAILPVWHNVSRARVMKYSPTLADRVAAKSTSGMSAVVRDLVAVLKQSPVVSKLTAK